MNVGVVSTRFSCTYIWASRNGAVSRTTRQCGASLRLTSFAIAIVFYARACRYEARNAEDICSLSSLRGKLVPSHTTHTTFDAFAPGTYHLFRIRCKNACGWSTDSDVNPAPGFRTEPTAPAQCDPPTLGDVALRFVTYLLEVVDTHSHSLVPSVPHSFTRSFIHRTYFTLALRWCLTCTLFRCECCCYTGCVWLGWLFVCVQHIAGGAMEAAADRQRRKGHSVRASSAA